MLRKISILMHSKDYYMSDIKFYVSRIFLWFFFAVAAILFLGVSKKLALKFSMMSARSRLNWLSLIILKKYSSEIWALFYQRRELSESEVCELVGRSLILKNPKNEEKGILLIKFSETLELFVRSGSIRNVLGRYVVVLEPSWAGYALPQILALTHFPEKIYIQCADAEDHRLITGLGSNLIPIKTGSGDWVDQRIFKRLKREDLLYDIVLVANCNPIKRVHRFLHLIDQVSRKKQIKAALVCSSFGANYNNMKSLIAAYDMDFLDYYEDLAGGELNKIFNKSKVNCLLSLKEGSNRTLFEGMSAGVRGVLVANNVGVNRDHLQEPVGYILTEPEMQQLMLNLDSYDNETVRIWAEKNISPEATMKKILSIINSNENVKYSIGEVKLKVNKPEARYMIEDEEYSAENNKKSLEYMFS